MGAKHESITNDINNGTARFERTQACRAAGIKAHAKTGGKSGGGSDTARALPVLQVRMGSVGRAAAKPAGHSVRLSILHAITPRLWTCPRLPEGAACAMDKIAPGG